MAEPHIWFEDVVEGGTLPLAPYKVTETEVRAFAEAFDPQPVHLDHDAAKDTVLGGLAASGWHVASMVMRMLCDGYLLDAASMGSPGMEKLRWRAPVRPGDRLTGTCTCHSARVSNSRPEMGICVLDYTVQNQAGTTVFTMRCTQLFRRRSTA